ncbi:MAG TPA: response regulator transcription factor [Anaerolineales bacterium]|nr:response regulator transcription factor [Anaerolineales bacterium]
MDVLVADDHSLFRDGIVSLLEAAGHRVVAQVGDGQGAVAASAELSPDLILLDLAMPGMDGLEALAAIKSKHPSAKVVILTVSTNDDDLYRAIRAGADGYLLKSLTSADFLEMLSGLDRGEAAISRATATRLMEGFADDRQRAEPALSRLTERETVILRLVAEGQSNKAIGRIQSISENTVKYYMKNILQKLGARNRAEAAALAIRSGLIKERAPVH